jgi:hypothetical protein
MRAAMRRLQDEMDDLRDSLDLAEARATNRGKEGRPLEEVMRERGLEPKGP